jgi:hypothetical protein
MFRLLWLRGRQNSNRSLLTISDIPDQTEPLLEIEVSEIVMRGRTLLLAR